MKKKLMVNIFTISCVLLPPLPDPTIYTLQNFSPLSRAASVVIHEKKNEEPKKRTKSSYDLYTYIMMISFYCSPHTVLCLCVVVWSASWALCCCHHFRLNALRGTGEPKIVKCSSIPFFHSFLSPLYPLCVVWVLFGSLQPIRHIQTELSWYTSSVYVFCSCRESNASLSLVESTIPLSRRRRDHLFLDLHSIKQLLRQQFFFQLFRTVVSGFKLTTPPNSLGPVNWQGEELASAFRGIPSRFPCFFLFRPHHNTQKK